MNKTVFMHGRFVGQCSCDKCKRVIYMTDSIHQRIKFARSYTRGKEDYDRINKERANMYDVWSHENEHIYSLCYPCLKKMKDDNYDFHGMDIVDNLEKCFYTEISDDKILVDSPDIIFDETFIPKPPVFNITLEKRYLKDPDGNMRPIPEAFFDDNTST